MSIPTTPLNYMLVYFFFIQKNETSTEKKKGTHKSLQMYIDISQIGLSKLIKMCAFLLLLAVDILLEY